MNLLISCGVFHPHQGGAESLFGDLSERLTTAGHAVHVITRRLGSTAERESHRGATIRRFAYPVPYEALEPAEDFGPRSENILQAIRRTIEERGVDVVCIGLLDMSAIYLLRLRTKLRFRLVLYLHGAETRELQQSIPSYRRLLMHCLRACDAVVAVSRGLAREAVALHPPVHKKLRVIPNGIDFEAVRRCVPYKQVRPYVLYAGRLDGDKRVIRIVEAFAQIAGHLPEYDLLIAGTGDRELSIRAAIEKHELGHRVQLLGGRARGEVFALMKGARFLTLASDAEGLPIVVLEAFAAGSPVLAPRVPGVTELVEDGRNGLLFEPGAGTEFAMCMKALCASDALWNRLRAGVAEFDPKSYDINVLWRSHLQVLAGTRD